MQPPCTNDVVLLASLLYSCVDLGCEWDTFNTCRRPIHVWLLVSYCCVLTFRLAHLLGSKSKDAYSRNGVQQSSLAVAADFLLDLRQAGPVARLLMAFTWLVALPAFVVCTLVGTRWLYEVVMETPKCVPSVTHLWFSGFWLVLSYIWIVVHVAVGVVALFLERRMRRAEADLGAVEDADVRARWGEVSRLSDYTALPDGRPDAALSPGEIAALPGLALLCDGHTKCNLGCDNDCSICLNGFEINDRVRTLGHCGHTFHRSCIDLWLLRRADCPLCKRCVRGDASRDP